MKLGVYTAVLHDRSLRDALTTIRSLGLLGAEINDSDGAEALHALVAPGGRVASATYSADVEALADKGITGTNIMSPGDRKVLGRLCSLVDEGKLRVPLSARFILDEGPAALAAHAQHKRGKIGLSIGT